MPAGGLLSRIRGDRPRFGPRRRGSGNVARGGKPAAGLGKIEGNDGFRPGTGPGTKGTAMEPMGPGRRPVFRRKGHPAGEEEAPFPPAGETPRKKERWWGSFFLAGASIPLLLFLLFLAAFYSQGRGLFHGQTYPPALFQQLVEGKTMEEVLEFLGPPARLGPDGGVSEWVYAPGVFDVSLYPYLPWVTPIMNRKVVFDPVRQKSPRRIVIRFGVGKEGGTAPGARRGDPRPVPRATVRYEE